MRSPSSNRAKKKAAPVAILTELICGDVYQWAR